MLLTRLRTTPVKRAHEEPAEGRGTVSECRKCVAGACSHMAQCQMMIRWYGDPWDGTFWRRCECPAWIIQDTAYPVMITRVSKGARAGDMGSGPEQAHGSDQ